jgi:protein SCO1
MARIVALLLLLATPALAPAQMSLRTARRDVAFEQKPGEQVPLDVRLRDEAGRDVVLRDYMDGKPAVLLLAYYRCPGLCSLALNGLAETLRELPQAPGKDFTLLTVSFDPGDSAELAAAKKQAYKQAYLQQLGGRGETAWHFFTGSEREVKRLADSVGFRYAYDPDTGEYAHASGLVVLTPNGKVSRYLLGVAYNPRDLRLALVEASEGRIGSPVDQVLLYCLSYDPVTGRYRLAALTAMRGAALLTVVVLGAWVTSALVRERRKRTAMTALNRGPVS